jgi:hypothetical protein
LIISGRLRLEFRQSDLGPKTYSLFSPTSPSQHSFMFCFVFLISEFRAGRVSEVVEHLPSRCEAWVQTPVMPKKKKKNLTLALIASVLHLNFVRKCRKLTDKFMHFNYVLQNCRIYLKNFLLLTQQPFHKDQKMKFSTNVESAGKIFLYPLEILFCPNIAEKHLKVLCSYFCRKNLLNWIL